MRVTELNVAESRLSLSRPEGDALVIHLSGDCRTGHDLPSTNEVQKGVESESDQFKAAGAHVSNSG